MPDTVRSERARNQTTAIKIIIVLEHFSCEERLRELGLFTAEKALRTPH